MDVLDPHTASHPSLHRLSSTSSLSSRPGLVNPPGTHEDGGPTRFRRMSSSNSVLRLDKEEIRDREMLVNEYEAEEERLVNVLARRMEELRSENTSLHNTMEGESEAVVNKLQRQLQTLQAQIAALSPQSQPQSQSSAPPLSPRGIPPLSPSIFPPSANLGAFSNGGDPLQPTDEKVLEALKRENESLRGKLSDAERGFIHVSRLNDVYREELIQHRTRLSLPITDLIAPPPQSPVPSFTSSSQQSNLFTQPLHRRTSSSSTNFHHPRVSRSPAPTLTSASTSPAVSNRIPIIRPSGTSSSSSSFITGGGSMDIDGSFYAGGGGGGSPEVERRLSFGAGAGGASGGRVAERGSLRRKGSASTNGNGGAGEVVVEESL